MENTRRVMVTHYAFGYECKHVDGTFHRWGNSKQYSNKDDSYFPFTVAIVELDDGQVVEVSPGDVRFDK